MTNLASLYKTANEIPEPGYGLDERLCRLLEPKPNESPDSEIVYLATIDMTIPKPRSLKGFWLGSEAYARWSPIPVSTSWEAAGRVIEELTTRNYSISVESIDCLIWRDWYVKIKWGKYPSVQLENAYGKTIPHAIVVAAVKALEAR